MPTDEHPDTVLTEGTVTSGGHTTAYLAAGPEDGPLIVFVHGWPAIARTWKHQLTAFGALGFRAVAPDMRGYGGSTVHPDRAAYAQQHVVADMVALLDHLGRERAVWVGHDWGCATVWGLAAHHPERCAAVSGICVPYGVLERGLETLVRHVDRSIYPADTHPYAQFDYIDYYRRQPERAARVFEAEPYRTVKALYRRGNPDAFGKPAVTSTVTRDGGWFGGADAAPDVPADTVVLDAELLAELGASFARNGFSAPTAYYLNDEANLAYTETSVDGGRLAMPVLFIGARYDAVADTSFTRLAEPMREHCADLTEATVDTGHWAPMERPAEVNAALAGWLARKVPGQWPGA
ncbi:alpha/beta fold hydrolase [Streptantibioticus cattleyicolor]|uniref:AB hydrolase-1 domain-containing protein n=1 Tax=Streptantibioticus cattleyicolor (strain ATCC 35852 / DSM 46488 / JCM 4925 / NBRC 14057 / NRRL 8057) TaxID=1003195 RepID=F8JN79_STREN|nr:alpha/beta hydrolase [Streptantibioticus cattleyicolor]AEW99164.1 hypothetical protein SCATT_p09710 [Streptantibioticus cattleyicolor NRRL 8057 = DSM 46488]CCB71793.1 conserved protein of unknown function [Streptantibioticus cattleyicolor NRRL 8057 = DSM 46488]